MCISIIMRLSKKIVTRKELQNDRKVKKILQPSGNSIRFELLRRGYKIRWESI